MINFIAFLLCIIAYFLFFNIRPVETTYSIAQNFLEERPSSIKKEVFLMNGKKKENFVLKYVKEVENILKKTNKLKQLPIIYFLAICGAFLSSLLSLSLNNPFLAPVVFIIFLLLPFLYVKQVSNSYKKELDEELETTMSVITSSYDRNNNIISAIEENLDYINPPVRDSFEKFLTTVNISPNIEDALKELRKEFNNPIFKEWIDNLILCREDSSIKSILPTIVKKMSSIKIINSETQVITSSSKSTFSILSVFAMICPFIVMLLPQDLIGDFFGSNTGKIAVSVLVAVAFSMYLWVLKIIEPIEE